MAFDYVTTNYERELPGHLCFVRLVLSHSFNCLPQYSASITNSQSYLDASSRNIVKCGRTTLRDCVLYIQHKMQRHVTFNLQAQRQRLVEEVQTDRVPAASPQGATVPQAVLGEGRDSYGLAEVSV